MNEGWGRDEYLIVFAASEVATMTERYAFFPLLPGFRLSGLRSCDNFIVRDSGGSPRLRFPSYRMTFSLTPALAQGKVVCKAHGLRWR